MVISGTSSGPCACCGGGGGGNCTLECQSIGGSANLCGIPEFIPSAVPKFYGNKNVTGLMSIGGGSSLTAPPCTSPTYPNSWSFNGAVSTNCSPGVAIVNLAFVPVGPGSSGGTTKYQASVTGTLGGSPMTGAVLQGFFHLWGDGDQHDVPDGTISTIFLTYALCTFGPTGTSPTLQTGGSPIPQNNDNWSIQIAYDLITSGCPQTTNTNNSQRFFNTSYTFPNNSGTTVYPNPLVDPPSYPSDLVIVTASSSSRSQLGKGICVATADYPTLGPYIIAEGTVTETLNNADSKTQAVARAVGSSPAWVSTGCAQATSFTTDPSYSNPDPSKFSFRKSQVRGFASGLTVGGQYRLTIGFYSRAVGTSNPFIFYALQQIDFVADNISDQTDWIDVPMVDGMEVEAKTCLNVRTG